MGEGLVLLDGPVWDEVQDPGGWSDQIAVTAVGSILRIPNN